MPDRHTFPAIYQISAPILLGGSVCASFFLSNLLSADVDASVLLLVFCGAGASVCSAALALSPEHRHAAVLLLVVGFGLVLGYSTARRMDRVRRRAVTGVPLERVSSFRGTAIADARRISGGRTLVSVEMRTVTTPAGDHFSASGTALVFVRPDESGPGRSASGADSRMPPAVDGPYRGETVVVAAQPVPATDSVDVAYLAFTGSDRIRRSAADSPVARARNEIYRRLSTLVDRSGGDGAPLFRALFLGDTEQLSAEQIADFRNAGCAHILALSGMHLGIITILFSLLLTPIIGRRPAFFSGALFVCLYIFIVGPRASLVRAGIMYLMFGSISLRGRSMRPLDVLALALVVQIVATPLSAFSLSFQLSYLALAGILVFGVRVHRVLAPWLTPPVSAGISASIGAQIAALPLLIVQFGVFHPIGTVASVVLTPIVTAFMWLGISGLFLGSAPHGVVLAGAPNPSALLAATARVAEHIASFFGAVPGVQMPPAAAVLLVALAICATGFGYVVRRRRARI